MSTGVITSEQMLAVPAAELSDPVKLAAEPVVSVIMVAYNHEPFIAKAIEGVLLQKSKFPIELLIGEDCSTDKTREICLAYQRRHPAIIRLIIANENVGGYQNWVRLLARARGPYLAFCDGDDYWCDESKLEKQVGMLEANQGMNLCFSRTGICEGNRDDIVTEWFPRREKKQYTIEDFISARVTASSCTLCLRREVISMFPKFIQESGIGDWALIVLSLLGSYAGYIPERLAIYRLHPNGTWQATSAQKRYEAFNSTNRALRTHLGRTYHRSFDTSLARAYLGYAEAKCEEQGRFGLVAILSTLKECPVSCFGAGRTLAVFLIHMGLPKIYARLLASGVFKRMKP